MALFEQQQKKLLGQERVIDGNKIIRENRKRNSQQGSYGMIRDNSTGEVIETRSDRLPQQLQQENPQEIHQNTPTPRDTTYDSDIMDADEGYRQYAQAYEYETGMVPSYEEYQSMNDGYNAGDGQEHMTEDQITETQMDYANTMGAMSNFMEDKGISFEKLVEMLPLDDLEGDGIDTQAMIEKLRDPRKIESMSDAINVGMAIDYFADFLNLDTDKFFSTGEVEECGDECQQRRADDAKAFEKLQEVPSYEDRLASLEQQQ